MPARPYVVKKSLYGSRWQHYRLAQLRAEPLCRLCLETTGRPVPATVVDHIERHDGTHADPRFWDPNNFQSLCKPCHDAVKQALDRSGFARGYDARGLPLYPGSRRHTMAASSIRSGTK
jgi:5-methylcytosine-specific restriction enzyme A